MVNVINHFANKVFLGKDGIVHGVYHGPQTGQGMRETLDRMIKIMEILLRDDKPIRVLVDISDMGLYDPMARLVEMHARTILPFWKMAFVTSDNHPPAEDISRKLTLMSGRRKEIRYFQREDDAKGWLNIVPTEI